MKKSFFLVLGWVCLSGSLMAQNDADALRYAMLQYGSTARSLGAGAAMGAMGGDMGAISINPGGLGVYRSSELQFSPGFSYTGTQADYLGNGLSDGRANLHVSSFGLVLSGQNERYRFGNGLQRVSTNFAFGFNRVGHYSAGRDFRGFNADNSLLDAYTEFLNAGSGTNPGDAYNADPFGAGLAYDAFLLNPIPGDTTRYFNVASDGEIWQQKTTVSRGAVNEMLFALGTNLGHKLYIGGSIGVPFVRYVEDYTYSEQDLEDARPGFDRFSQRTRLNTSGSGINAKIGLIARPVESIRIGAAVHSPTRFRMRDEFDSEIFSDIDGPTYQVFSPFGLFDYTLRSPWRVVGSLGLLLRDRGFISLDYEYLDYGFSAFDFTRGGIGGSEFEGNLNALIQTKYQSAHNLRGGVEIVAEPMRFRAGYSYLGTPFAEGRATGDADQTRQAYHGGLGYRSGAVFVDLAYVHTVQTLGEAPYTLAAAGEPIPFARYRENRGTAVLTMGVKF
jgi:hypothetical protein